MLHMFFNPKIRHTCCSEWEVSVGVLRLSQDENRLTVASLSEIHQLVKTWGAHNRCWKNGDAAR